MQGVRAGRSEALRACCATAGQPRGRGAPTPPVQVSSDLDSRPCAYHVRGEAQAPTWTARAHGRRRRATCDERHADGEALARAMSCRLNVRRARNGGGLWAELSRLAETARDETARNHTKPQVVVLLSLRDPEAVSRPCEPCCPMSPADAETAFWGATWALVFWTGARVLDCRSVLAPEKRTHAAKRVGEPPWD